MLDEGLSVFSKNNFEIAELCSFLLADCQGEKAPFRFDYALRMTFSVGNFVFGEDQITLTCFQMWFLSAPKQSGRSTWNKKNLNVNYGGVKFSECFFLLKLLDERLLIFENSFWFRADWSSEVELIRRYKTPVDLKVQRFEKLIWFLA